MGRGKESSKCTSGRRPARASPPPLPLDRLATALADRNPIERELGQVVHRDIKPENSMLSGRQQMTTAGVALGTPAYMAPEQASADPQMDQRVDIYALGSSLGEPKPTGLVESYRIEGKLAAAEDRPGAMRAYRKFALLRQRAWIR